MALKILLNNDNTIELDNLINTSTSVYDNGATVLCDILDRDGTSVVGSPLIAMSQVAESPDQGKYRGTIPSTTTLNTGQLFTIKLYVTGSAGEVAEWTIRARVVERSE